MDEHYISREAFGERMVSPVNELLRQLNEQVFGDNINIEKLGLAVGLVTDFVWQYAPLSTPNGCPMAEPKCPMEKLGYCDTFRAISHYRTEECVNWEEAK